MRHIGRSKIGKLSAKGITYPQLRLPHQYSSTIGDVAGIFETEHEGKQAFLIVTEQRAPKSDTVLKPSAKVLKPCDTVAHRANEILVEDQADCVGQSEVEERLCTRIETFNSSTILHEPLPDTPIGSRSRGPKRVRGRHL